MPKMKIDWRRVWRSVDDHSEAPELGFTLKQLIRRLVMKHLKVGFPKPGTPANMQEVLAHVKASHRCKKQVDWHEDAPCTTCNYQDGLIRWLEKQMRVKVQI